MEAFAYSLVNYSFLALSVGERLLFLSFAGWLLVWLVARLFGRLVTRFPVRMAPLWWIYLLWLIPAATPFLPGVPGSWLEHTGLENTWFAALMLTNPCAISPVERLGQVLYSPTSFITTSLCLVALWIMVSAGLLYRLFIRRQFFSRVIARAEPVKTSELLAVMRQLTNDFALRRQVTLHSSAEYPAPFTMGLLNPAIFIPAPMLAQLPMNTLKAMLAHEFAHIARRDDLAVLWQQFSGVIFFFNPLLRHANRQLAEVREICCDALAIRKCKLDRREYAQSLVTVVEYLGTVPDADAPVAGFLSQDIQTRLGCLTKCASPRRATLLPALLLLIGLGSISFFLGGTGKPLAPVMDAERVHALLDNVKYTRPLAGGEIVDHVHIGQPLSCMMHARDEYHAGVDFAPPSLVSTPVIAFATGKIIAISTPPGDIGKIVRIEHSNQLVSTYARLDNIELPVGARVQSGQIFASVGATVQTNHLHFELSHQGRILDPSVLF